MKTTLIPILVTAAAVITPSAVVHAQGQTAVSGTRGSNSPMSRGEKEEAVTEALIRQRVEDYAKAISAKDIDGVMSFFAPNMVSFDIAIKALRYVGADGKRREWQEDFNTQTKRGSL